MSSSVSLYRWRSEPLRPARNFRELIQRDVQPDTPEYAWLATLLEDRPNLSPIETKTEISIFDVGSDGKVRNPRFSSLSEPGYASEWLQSPRKPDDRVRIIYVGIEKEDIFDKAIIDAVAMKYNLDHTFFLDHFLPSLWSDKRIHEYLRLKDCEGRNTSITFVCKDDRGAEKTVIMLGPIEANVQPPEDYKFQLSNFGKRREGTPVPAMYNGSEYCYPIIQLLSKEYSRFLHNLKLQELSENNVIGVRRRVVATEERLRYCLYNLTVLGDDRNPETVEIVSHIQHLIELAKQLKVDVDDWVEKETKEQNKKAADRNLQTAMEATYEARASREIGENIWKLTLLAFIFIPLNFMTSAFAMHLRLLGFHEDDGGLPAWSFFAVAVPVELLVLILFGAMSGYLGKAWKRLA